MESPVRTIRRNRRAAADKRGFFALVACEYLPSGPPICANVSGLGAVWLRPGTSDTSVVAEITSGCYEPAAAAVDRPARIVDLGAHIGLVSRLLQGRHPSAELIAVEPHPENVAILRRNVPNATIIDRPVAASHRRVQLAGVRLDGFAIAEGGELETITMTDIPGHIDLLKIDVEGVEEELFADCSRWIDRVSVIVCECHHPYTGRDMLGALDQPEVVSYLKMPHFGYDLVTVRLK